MRFTHWLSKVFGPQVHGARVARRGKSRKPQQRWMPQLELLEDRLAPATLTVTNLNDSGVGSLRQAIANSVQRVNGASGNDTIQFSPNLAGGTIYLTTSRADNSVFGQTAILVSNSDTLVIDGQTGLSNGITIARSSSAAYRLFQIYPLCSVTFKGLTLTGGISQGGNGGSSDGGGGGGGGAAGMGGAIFNQGNLTLLNSTLTGNGALGGNGGNSSAVYSGGGGGGGGMSGPGGHGNAGKITAGILHLYGGGGGPPNGGHSDYRATVFESGTGEPGGLGGGGAGGLADTQFGLPSAASGFTGGWGGGGGGGGEVSQRTSPSFLPSYNGQEGAGAGGGVGGFGGGGGGSSSNSYRSLSGSPGGYGGGGGGGSDTNGNGGGGGGGAGMGGAVFNEAGTVVITNSTIAGNTAVGGFGGKGLANNGGAGQGLGGGLFNHNGTVTVTNSTFSGNNANQGGRGIFNLGDAQSKFSSSNPSTASLTINNTIIAQSDTAVSDLANMVANAFTGGITLGKATVSGQTNLIGTITTSAPVATTSLTGTITGDPKLGPLQNNGGLTATMALGLGSPAFDAGTTSLAPTTDQRGMARVGNADIGAYENPVAGQLVVNTTANDFNLTDSKLSLREALGLVNGTINYFDLSAASKSQITRTAGVGITITFDASLDGSTITLSTVGDNSVGKSALLVNSPVVIDGPAGDNGITLAVAAGTPMRLFDVTSTGNLTLQNLTLKGGTVQGQQGGSAGAGGTGGGSAGLGGAVFNQGTLTILDSTLTGNTAQGGAGGALGGAGLNGAGGAGLSTAGSAAAAGRYGGVGGGPNGAAGGGPFFFGVLPGGVGGFGGGGGGGYGIAPAVGQTLSSSHGGSGGFGGGGGGGGAFTALGGGGGFGGGGGGAYGGGGYGGGSGGGGVQAGLLLYAPGGGGAGMGGAIFNEAGTVVITNSTFSANVAVGGAGGLGIPSVSTPAPAGKGLGGGLFNHNGTIIVANSTFSGNTAAQGGRGIFNLGDSTFATTASTTAIASISNTILGQTDNSVEDFTGKTVGSGTNTTLGSGDLIRKQSGFNGTVVSTADPQLGPLQDNGGPTPTMALLTGSPAIDAGSKTATPMAFAVYAGQTFFGPLQPGTYFYRVSAFNAVGETLASMEYAVSVPRPSGLVYVYWNAVSGPVSGYKVYGRTFGSEQLIATLGPSATSYTDNGSITPSGALPTADTTLLTTDQRGVIRPPSTDIGAFEFLPVSQTYNVTSNAQAQTVFQTINAMAPQSPTILVQVNLAAGTYTDIVLDPPAGVVVVLTGTGANTVIVGHSPALTVNGGQVEVDDLTLETTTDSPTVMVSGGNLTMWQDVTDESPGFDDPAIDVTGGNVDLGTADDPGNDQFDGQGDFLNAADPNDLTADGDTFDVNGTTNFGSEPTTTTVTTLAGSTVPGQGAQFTATVTAWNGGTPTGDVDFFDVTANADLGQAPVNLVDGVAQAALTISQLSLGSHQIQATYLGDSTFIPSQGVAVVNQPAPVSVTGSAPGTAPVVTVSGGDAAAPMQIMAFDSAFTGGVTAAVLPLPSGTEIIAAAGPGGGPAVEVFDAVTGALIREFFAFDPTFTGGVNVAAGSIDGDAVYVVAAGPGGGPQVNVYSASDGSLRFSFFAYDPTFAGGVRVAVGNGNGTLEIITGAGAGGGPQVNAFDGTTGELLRSFFAFDPTFSGGVYVTAGDVNGDGQADIAVGAGSGGGPAVSVFDGAGGALLESFFAYDPAMSAGVLVALSQLDSDGTTELWTGQAPTVSAPHVFDPLTGANLDQMFAAGLSDGSGLFAGNSV